MSGSLNDYFLVSCSTQLSFILDNLWKVALFCLNRKLTISDSIRILLLRDSVVSYRVFTSAVLKKAGNHPVHLKTTFHDFRFFLFTGCRRISFHHQSKRQQCFISRKIVMVILNSSIMKNDWNTINTTYVLIFMMGFYLDRHQFTHLSFLIFLLLFQVSVYTSNSKIRSFLPKINYWYLKQLKKPLSFPHSFFSQFPLSIVLVPKPFQNNANRLLKIVLSFLCLCFNLAWKEADLKHRGFWIKIRASISSAHKFSKLDTGKFSQRSLRLQPEAFVTLNRWTILFYDNESSLR